MNLGFGRIGPPGLARIGEEGDRWRGPDQDEMPGPLELSNGLVDGVDDPLDGIAPLPALDPPVGERRQEPRTARRGDAVGVGQGRGTQRGPGKLDHHGLVPPKQPGDILDRRRRYTSRRRCCARSAGNAAGIPADIGGQDQCCDRAGGRAGREDRLGGIRAHLGRAAGRAHPARDTSRPAFGIRRERGIQRPVIAGLVAHDIHHRHVRSPGVVEIGKPVREAGPAMEKRGRGPLRHAGIAVGGPRHHPFEQPQH